MPRRSWPSSWPTASTSPPRSPTAVMSSSIGSPSGTVPCWPSRRPASAPSTYWSPRTARSWAGSTCTTSRTAPQNSATGSRSTSQAAAWRPRPSGSYAVWRRRNTDCARSRRPPSAGPDTACSPLPWLPTPCRIIQEGLTNSMKHAPGAPVSVTLEATATGLNIDIINEPARSAPLELDGGAGGAGLPGMTERVKAHGGQLSAGARAGRRLAGSRQPALGHSPGVTPCRGRPQHTRWNMKDPQTARNKSSVRVTGREPEARGANDTPDHPPQTREYPSSSRLARIRPHATRHRRSADQPLRRSAAA